jgi:hypothetical protein
MGLLGKLFLVIVPGIGLASAAAFSLGKELPKVCRRTGRSIGMGYNYLKVTLKLITPESDSTVDLVRKMRQSTQQAFAFSNEVKWNMLKLKTDVKAILPDLTDDPFTKFGITPDTPVKPTSRLTGTELLDVAYKERRRLQTRGERVK